MKSLLKAALWALAGLVIALAAQALELRETTILAILIVVIWLVLGYRISLLQERIDDLEDLTSRRGR